MIKVLIDSASDIDKKEAEALGINMIPMEITFGEETFLDGVNLSHIEFFEKLAGADFPKTSQINEYRFKEEFERLTSNGDKLIVITMSSKLSGTYESALSASKEFKGKVFVFDSLNVTIGERILLEYAMRLIKEGYIPEAIIEKLTEKRDKVYVLALLDTLKYLRKGGRISSLVAFTGEVFSIKPVVAVREGEVKLAGKAVGLKKGNNLLSKLINDCGGVDFSMPFAGAYSGKDDKVMKAYLEDSRPMWEGKCKEVPYYLIGSTIGTHVGPGAVAVAFFSN